ncbi:MAG: hypothetical protein HZC37_13445 [Burkholderiales bacterium]|nr:hypothetical protein [Burkholderiales bacterium]
MGTSPTELVIAGAGLVSPVGLSLAETAAAARARMARLGESEWLDGQLEPFIVGRVPDEGLPEPDAALSAEQTSEREVRMLQLAHAALDEALAPLRVAARQSTATAPLPLLLGLPEHPGAVPIDPATFIARLARQADGLIDARRSVAAPRGRAAGLMALNEAAARLLRGDSEFILVGGVDSLLDEALVQRLDIEGRIRNETTSDGFTPAEGAAFLLLARAETASARGLKPLAKLLGYAHGFEPGHLYSDEKYLGEGLAGTLAALLSRSPPPAPIATVFCSFNGERYWAREFGVARLRHGKAFVAEQAMEHPAECFGDIGAAFGPALAALAAHGIRHGYRAGPCLVYASSDRGERAAALLARAH